MAVSLTKVYSKMLAHVARGDSALSFRHTQTNVDGFRPGNPKALTSQLLTKGKKALLSPTDLTKAQTPNS